LRGAAFTGASLTTFIRLATVPLDNPLLFKPGQRKATLGDLQQAVQFFEECGALRELRGAEMLSGTLARTRTSAPSEAAPS